MWADHIDPAHRADALGARGRRARLHVAHLAGRAPRAGRRPPARQRRVGAATSASAPRAATGAAYDYDELLPDDVLGPDGARRLARRCWARRARCASRTSACCGSDGCRDDLGALTANMAAWNRWCASIVADGARPPAPGRPPHAARRRTGARRSWRRSPPPGSRSAMIAPAPVDGRPLSHPDHEPHLGGVRRARRDAGVPRGRPAAGARRGLVHGCRRPFVPVHRVGVPLGAAGGGAHRPDPQRRARPASRAAARRRRAQLDLGAAVPVDARRRRRLHHAGSTAAHCAARTPTERLRARASADRVVLLRGPGPPHRARAGDVFMCCSDYPHSEGTADPVGDYARAGSEPDADPALFHENVRGAARLRGVRLGWRLLPSGT